MPPKCISDSTEHQDRLWRLIYIHVSQTEQEHLGQDNTVATLQVTQPTNPVRLPAGVEISSKTSPLSGDLGRFHCGKSDQQLPFNSKGNRAAAESPSSIWPHGIVLNYPPCGGAAAKRGP